SFGKEDAVAYLGVGKNMVTAIKFWMKAFGMASEDGPSELSTRLLSDDGWDPYLEDIGSLWLLHYHLVKEKHNSIASIIFNELRDRTPEFNVHNYTGFVTSEKTKANTKTLSGTSTHSCAITGTKRAMRSMIYQGCSPTYSWWE
ncbi:MAG: DUF4007 family protein, partial [Flavobacteriales bacterium]|nr:DUF4007 family protein [Flavobacteriales bacterium]